MCLCQTLIESEVNARSDVGWLSITVLETYRVLTVFVKEFMTLSFARRALLRMLRLRRLKLFQMRTWSSASSSKGSTWIGTTSLSSSDSCSVSDSWRCGLEDSYQKMTQSRHWEMNEQTYMKVPASSISKKALLFSMWAK